MRWLGFIVFALLIGAINPSIAQQQDQTRYYCVAMGQYYPDTQTCPQPWVKLLPGDTSIAPKGYHYENSTLVPNDACWRPEIVSSANIGHINASIGHPKGVPYEVTSISDLNTADTGRLSGIGLRVPSGAAGGSISCQARLHFANGKTESGVLSVSDPGDYAPLQIEWLPDIVIAAHLAEMDGLRTSKSLLVKPDLKNPDIQLCVGLNTALGKGEQFPGQLWAACADKIGIAPEPVPPQADVSPSTPTNNSQCNAPPYGGTIPRYKLFIKVIGPLLDQPIKMLSGICKVKFEHGDRAVMYNLGITDEDIDKKSVDDLTVQMIEALKNFADKRPDL